MTNEIRVPDLGNLVTSATLGRWLKKVGENVAADEVVAEIDTNKAAVEVPAPVAGIVTEIKVQQGTPVVAGLLLGAVTERRVTAWVAKTTEARAVSNSPSASIYDAVVIGSGPGGYVCAIRAAQLGLKVAVVEKERTYGGTCLNVGCIPSKALLYASEVFAEAGQHFATLGIAIGAPALDLPAMMAHKDKTVAASVEGVAYLFRKNKIDTYHGVGRIAAVGQIEVTAPDGSRQILKTKNVVIATGSESSKLRGVDIDGERLVISDTAIAFSAVPNRLLIVGGGAIGLELGSVWSRLGSRVTVVDVLDHILTGVDREIADRFARLLRKQGFTLKLGSKVSGIERNGALIKVAIEPAAGGQTETIEVDAVLVATGRRAYTAGLGLAEIGVAQDEHGRVQADRHYRTNIDGIWAIGDVIAGPMLAHKASDEGIAVAEIIAGKPGYVNYDAIPTVVYTSPEVASVGGTEDDRGSCCRRCSRRRDAGLRRVIHRNSQIGAPLLIGIWGGAAWWLFEQDHQVWGIAMIGWGIFVSTIDNFIKPFLIGHGIQMPLSLTILAVFGGFFAFGFLGLFVGPTLIAVLFSLFQAWRAAQSVAY